MNACVYPGSFDPVTNGHLDIIKRASRMFDKVIVAIVHNPNKCATFSLEERVELMETVIQDMENVEVECFQGLLIDFMRAKKIRVIVKGLRAISDFENEFQMALMNRKLDNNIETVFMMTSERYSYLSSSAVREVGRLGGCIRDLVPDAILDRVIKRLVNKGD